MSLLCRSGSKRAEVTEITELVGCRVRIQPQVILTPEFTYTLTLIIREGRRRRGVSPKYIKFRAG